MARGRLRIYLGAAPGVGKTFAMLNEAHRRRDRGTDVVIAVVETHGRDLTRRQIGDLEVVPRLLLPHRGTELEEMDFDAVIARAPQVALVDELAHTNAPGSRHAKRWQDVEALLDAGIDVLSTVNIQHLESLNDVVEAITGVRQSETVPDEVVRQADQVELVDMTPEAIQRRMLHGNIYAPDRIDAALANHFRLGNLGALRELALLWVADQVDDALARYRADHDIDAPWETRERVVVAITDDARSATVIRRAARVAHRSHADLIGIHVRAADGRARHGAEEQLARNRQLLDDVGGVYHERVAADSAAAVVDFARAENATQLVLGASRRTWWRERIEGSVVNEVLRRSGGIDVHVLSLGDDGDDTRSHAPRASHVLPVRRRVAGWLVALVGTAALTTLLTHTRDIFDQGSQFVLFQVVVMAAAALGGTRPAIGAAVCASAALNWYFTPPLYTWTIEDPTDVVALVTFSVVGLAVGIGVTSLARRTLEARQGRAEAEALARVAGNVATIDAPLPSMLAHLVDMLGLTGAAVTDGSGEILASLGDPLGEGSSTKALPHGAVTVRGVVTDADRRMLEVFASQVESVLERRALREDAARSEVIAEADAMRTALLRAVSHDLRSPLAAIKASVSSLLDGDITLDQDDEDMLLAGIDRETDRLDAVIANLLDASRLQAGVVIPSLRLVELADVVAASLRSLGPIEVEVTVDLPDDLPPVSADEGLLERALANLVANAVRASPPGAPIEIAAAASAERVHLRVVDHGAGVDEDEHDRMFQPFRRLGDSSAGEGVGLGLSIARGFVEAMHGELAPRPTPGGGLTMVITLDRGSS